MLIYFIICLFYLYNCEVKILCKYIIEIEIEYTILIGRSHYLMLLWSEYNYHHALQ